MLWRLAIGAFHFRIVSWSYGVSNRNWLIHQYDKIDRYITWATLSTSLLAWTKASRPAFEEAHWHRCALSKVELVL